MNILIISKYIRSKETGFETRSFAIARIFAKKGHQISIVSSINNYSGNHFPKSKYNKIYNNERIDGINVTWMKVLQYKKTISIRRVLSWIDFEWKLLFVNEKITSKPDVIIVSSLSLLTILNGVRLKRKYNCKLIFEIRDIWPLTLTEEGGYSQSNPFVKLLSWIEKWGYRKSDLIVGTMPNLGEHVKEVMGKPFKTKCIPFGLNVEDYKVNKDVETTKNNYDIPADKFIIGYAGSIGLSNGLDTFIEVIKELRNNKNIYFFILGSGDLRNKYMEQLNECDNVKFINKVKREEVQNILAICNVLYFATLKSKVWNYGWSLNKLTEYMISGKPILASHSGHQSMINEADSGIIVPSENKEALKNALVEMSKMSSEELESMGERGKQWLIKNRQWETLADDYLSIMRELT